MIDDWQSWIFVKEPKLRTFLTKMVRVENDWSRSCIEVGRVGAHRKAEKEQIFTEKYEAELAALRIHSPLEYEWINER